MKTKHLALVAALSVTLGLLSGCAKADSPSAAPRTDLSVSASTPTPKAIPASKTPIRASVSIADTRWGGQVAVDKVILNYPYKHSADETNPVDLTLIHVIIKGNDAGHRDLNPALIFVEPSVSHGGQAPGDAATRAELKASGIDILQTRPDTEAGQFVFTIGTGEHKEGWLAFGTAPDATKFTVSWKQDFTPGEPDQYELAQQTLWER